MENNNPDFLQAKKHFNEGLDSTREVSQALKKLGNHELSEKFDKIATVMASFTDEDIDIISKLSPEDINNDEEIESEKWLKEPTC